LKKLDLVALLDASLKMLQKSIYLYGVADMGFAAKPRKNDERLAPSLKIKRLEQDFSLLLENV